MKIDLTHGESFQKIIPIKGISKDGTEKDFSHSVEGTFTISKDGKDEFIVEMKKVGGNMEIDLSEDDIMMLSEGEYKATIEIKVGKRVQRQTIDLSIKSYDDSAIIDEEGNIDLKSNDPKKLSIYFQEPIDLAIESFFQDQNNIDQFLRPFFPKDGYTPEKGKDYTDGYTPIKGVDYTDGYTPIKGVDYFTKKEVATMQKALKDTIISEIPQIITEDEINIKLEDILKKIPKDYKVEKGATFLRQLLDVKMEELSDLQYGFTYNKATATFTLTTISSSGGTWGTITGTLSNQTDLQTALDNRFLLAGRATPQQAAFGTATGASTGYLTSTSHATKGKYFLNAAGTITIDEVNVRLGIGVATPLYKLHVPTGTSYIGTILGVGTAAASGSFNFEVTGTSWFSSTTYFRQVAYTYNGSTNYMGLHSTGTTNKIFTLAANVNKDIVIQNGDVTTALFSNSASVATVTLGTAGATIGVLGLSGNTSGVVSIKPQATAGTYNFNLPTSAGSSGQPLISAGGGASAMTFGTLGFTGGGTGATSFSSNGIVYSGGSALTSTSSVNNAVLVTGGTGTPSLSTTLPDFTAGTITFADAKNIVFNTSNGTKIGTATTQKIGFYNATPIVQGASIADATGGVVIDSEARTAINALISRIEALGLIATV